jgi:transcriptional regulator with XRE-family HTH domain
MAKKAQKKGATDSDCLSIGDRIKLTISDRNLSAYAVAKAARVNTAIVLRFLNGERSISLVTAEKLAQALDLHLVPRGDQ